MGVEMFVVMLVVVGFGLGVWVKWEVDMWIERKEMKEMCDVLWSRWMDEEEKKVKKSRLVWKELE